MEDIMKTRFMLIIGLLLLCSACANTPKVKAALATEADPAAAYIYAVENSAFGNATRVYWVNPPRNKDLEKDKD
jgi:hypothetical protein